MRRGGGRRGPTNFPIGNMRSRVPHGTPGCIRPARGPSRSISATVYNYYKVHKFFKSILRPSFVPVLMKHIFKMKKRAKPVWKQVKASQRLVRVPEFEDVISPMYETEAGGSEKMDNPSEKTGPINLLLRFKRGL